MLVFFRHFFLIFVPISTKLRPGLRHRQSEIEAIDANLTQESHELYETYGLDMAEVMLRGQGVTFQRIISLINSLLIVFI